MANGRWLAAAILAGLLVAGCAGAPPASSGSKPAAGASKSAGVAGDANNGRQLFAAKGCIACHVAPGVPGAAGTIGPNLTGIGDSARRPELTDGKPNTLENLKQWIQNPQAQKPGTMMPNLNLSDKEADDLTAFLLTLK